MSCLSNVSCSRCLLVCERNKKFSDSSIKMGNYSKTFYVAELARGIDICLYKNFLLLAPGNLVNVESADFVVLNLAAFEFHGYLYKNKNKNLYKPSSLHFTESTNNYSQLTLVTFCFRSLTFQNHIRTEI